jgi:hypothetical protein
MPFEVPLAPSELQPPRLLDRQGWSTLLAGALLLLISFTTNDGDDNLLQFASLKVADQIGMGLHLAALAALVGVDEVFSEGVVELATRLRHRARNPEAKKRIARQRQALETARARGQATRRTRIQAGCLVAQCRFLLADTARNRLQLSEALAVLMEELRSPLG